MRWRCVLELVDRDLQYRVETNRGDGGPIADHSFYVDNVTWFPDNSVFLEYWNIRVGPCGKHRPSKRSPMLEST